LGVQVGQEHKVGTQDCPCDRGVRGGQCFAGGVDEPVRDRLADLQTTRCTKRMNLLLPKATSRAGSENSAATSRPTFVPNTSGSAKVSPGKARSRRPSNWFFVAVLIATRPVRCADQAVSSPSTSARL
jgi:hypothetical protein